MEPIAAAGALLVVSRVDLRSCEAANIPALWDRQIIPY
jgi:hypothetical protein